MSFIYLFIFKTSLNLFLCLHLAIKPNLRFKRLTGSMYNVICIFSSRRKLYLPSKHLGVVDLFKIFHCIFGVNPLFFNFQKCLFFYKITGTYIIDYNYTISQINDVTFKFANNIHIEDRLGKFNMKNAYLFKDDEPNFENKLQSRLINPSKTKLGIISKNIFQNIVFKIQKKTTHYKLWENSTDTIEWFRNVLKKEWSHFYSNWHKWFLSLSLYRSFNYAKNCRNNRWTRPNNLSMEKDCT